MTLNQRQYRSPLTPVALVLARLDREGAMDFGAVCDTASIPRDLRAPLLANLLRERHITREGDRVRLTEAGKQLARTPLTPPPPADTARNPSPRDGESRARMRGSRTRG